MDLFDELKTTWQAGPEPDLPDAAAIHQQLAAYQRRRRLFHLSQVVLLLLSAITIVWVMMAFDSKLWTTRAGEIIFLLCMAGAYWIRLQGERRNRHASEILPVAEYLERLRSNAAERFDVAPRKQAILYLLLSVGFFLYMYEVLSRNTTTLLIGYSILVLYLLGVWFLLRPYMQRRNRKSIEKLLQNIDHLQNQIS